MKPSNNCGDLERDFGLEEINNCDNSYGASIIEVEEVL